MLPRSAIIVLLITSYSVFKESVVAMRLVVQRVRSASVTVDGAVVSKIGPGAMYVMSHLTGSSRIDPNWEIAR
jgi:hypothetical protein